MYIYIYIYIYMYIYMFDQLNYCLGPFHCGP